MKTTILIIGTVVLAALVAAGAFWGGMTYQANQASQVRQEFMSARGMSGEGQMPFGASPDGGQFQPGGGPGSIGGGGTAGQVKTIEGDALTLSTAQDVTTVHLSGDTQIEKTVGGTVDDLQPGMRVLVTGERDGDGIISASRITILSDSMPAMPLDPGSANPPAVGTDQ